MRKRRPPRNLQAVRSQAGAGFHCQRVACYRKAIIQRVLTRPHQGPAMRVWVCDVHDAEISIRGGEG